MRINNFTYEYNLKKLKLLRVDNFKMYVTPRYINHYQKSQYEPYTSEILKNYIKNFTFFIDVGAHYGYFSILASKSNENIKIISVEPVKENFMILKKNLHINKVKNNKIFNFAISDKNGTRNFNITEASDSAGFYDHPLTKTKKIVSVETVCLDNIVPPDAECLIKIDVEGHEIAALNSLKKTLKTNKRITLLVEFYPDIQRKAGFEPEQLLNSLIEQGFEIYFISEEKKRLYRYNQNIYSWDRLMDDAFYTNLICVQKKDSTFITYLSHDAQLAGAETSLLELIEHTKKIHVFSHIIFPKFGYAQKKISGKAISSDVITFNWWTSNAGQFYNIGILQQIARVIKYTSVLFKINPHIICTNTVVVPWGVLLSRILGKPHVWFIHEFGSKDHGLKFSLKLWPSFKIISIFSEYIVYNSKSVQKYFDKYINKRKSKLIYYNIQIPEEMIYEHIQNIYKQKNSLKLIVVGWMGESKGQFMAVQAVNSLLKKKFKVELLLLGFFDNDDPYYKKIKKFVKDNRIQSIYIKNVVNNPYPYIKSADVLLMCSQNEAFGRVTAEAMLLKKPIIGVNSSGTTEMVKDKVTGLLYEYEHVDQLEQKILFFIKHKKKIVEFGNQGFEQIKKLQNSDRYLSSLNLIFNQLKKTTVG